MLYSEFTKLAGFEVKESYYHEVIEPEYNRSTLEKADWVKQWKKDGGIQKAYDAQVSRYEYKAGEVERLREMNENQAMIIREDRERLFNLDAVVETLKSDLETYRNGYDKAQKKLGEQPVKIQQKDNMKYITIYEVRACLIEDGKNITVDRFISMAEAEKEVQFCYDVHKKLYSHVWIIQQMVWC